MTCEGVGASHTARCLPRVDHQPWRVLPQEREMRLMTYEERVEAAERRRLEGNGLYKEGRLDEALSKYRSAGWRPPAVDLI